MRLKSCVLIGFLLLLFGFTNGLRADPVIGPAVEQHGLRFESWLASPKIVIPSKTVDYNHSTATMLFSVRATNLTQKPVRLNPFAARLRLIKPNGKEIESGFGIAGELRQPQKPDFMVLQPGQSLVLPFLSHLYWYKNGLYLDWPTFYRGRSINYEGLTAGSYYFTIDYDCQWLMPIFASRNIHSTKPVSTQSIPVLDDLWTGNVSVTSMTFEVTEPAPARPSPPLPKREGPEQP